MIGKTARLSEFRLISSRREDLILSAFISNVLNKKVLKPKTCWNKFKMQTSTHYNYFLKNVATDNEYILRKTGLKFQKVKLKFHILSKIIALGQKNNTLVSGNAGDEKNLHPGARNFFLIDFIKFSKSSLHVKFTLGALFFVENQVTVPFTVRREKRKFVRMNLLMENHLNGEFYCSTDLKI